jgi:hypothetical protein
MELSNNQIKQISYIISQKEYNFIYSGYYIVLDISETEQYLEYMDNTCYIIINKRIITLLDIYNVLKNIF